jgi:oxygen-dependent protoporphyrinogen oxidase
MKRIAIIGGGISGLAAAFALQKQVRDGSFEYVIIEASGRFGGVIQTERVNNCVIEAGPDSFLTEKTWAADLCRDLGLGDQLIGSNDAERKTFILLKNCLVPLPDGLMFMVPTKILPVFLSPLFSWRTKLRMAGEWFYPPHSSEEDCSVAKFVERHYGREMVERLVDPLLAGVYGGSADDLSVHSVLPRFAPIEASHGSLARAMVESRKTQPAQSSSRPLFTSLTNGMEQMIDSLLARIPESSRRLDTPITLVKPKSGKWLVLSAGQRTEEFDAVILALPTYAAAALLKETNAEASALLNAIRYSSSMTVVVGYDQDTRATLPAGFGFLVPQSENRRIRAATFVHNKFPHRAPENVALIRCFLGGTRDAAVVESSDDELQDLVRRELRDVLSVTAQPHFVRVYKWHRAMAQYDVGHKAKVERIRDLVEKTPGVALAGNAYSGIGVPDCVRSGSEAAAKILADLGINRVSR